MNIADSNNNSGTGAFFETKSGQGYGHHILTAGHVLNNAKSGLLDKIVDFTLPRAGYSKGVKLSINAPASANYQLIHPLFARGTTGNSNAFDIGIVRLVDQNKTSQNPGRLMVGPYSAQPYGLFSGNEIGRDVTIAGYGNYGAGASGEVAADGKKRVGVNKIEFDGKPFVQNAAYAAADPVEMMVTYDFDNGQAANDAFGMLYATSNTGRIDMFGQAIDAMGALGDSGGPFLIDGEIAAVYHQGWDTKANIFAGRNFSFGEIGVGTRVSKSLTDFINPVLEGGVQDTTNKIIALGSIEYDLVFDMNYQVYGRSDAFGTGGMGPPSPDSVAIHAKTINGNLEIWVTGPDANLNGRAYPVTSS